MEKNGIDFKTILASVFFLGLAAGAVQHGLDLQRAVHVNDMALAQINIQARTYTGKANLAPLVNAAANDFRRGSLVGVWAQNATVRVGPKNQDGEDGYWIVSPLMLNDGTVVVVNRGWVPERVAQLMLDDTLPAGVITLTGYLRQSDLSGSTKPVKQQSFDSLNVDAIAGAMNADKHAALALFAESSQPADDDMLKPVSQQASLSDLPPNRPVLWFGFAAACVAAFVMFVVMPRLQARHSAS